MTKDEMAKDEVTKTARTKWEKSPIYQMRCVLADLYPNTFVHPGSKERKKPLKVKIHEDILKQNPGLKPWQVKQAIADYISGPKYYAGIMNCKKRVDLEGKDVGFVSFEDREFARTKWKTEEAEFNKRRNERNPSNVHKENSERKL